MDQILAEVKELKLQLKKGLPKGEPRKPDYQTPAASPVAKSRVFQNVMQALGIEWMTHIPAGKDGERVTARSKGKVERPFRTVKEAHETLYHSTNRRPSSRPTNG